MKESEEREPKLFIIFWNTLSNKSIFVFSVDPEEREDGEDKTHSVPHENSRGSHFSGNVNKEVQNLTGPEGGALGF